VSGDTGNFDSADPLSTNPEPSRRIVGSPGWCSPAHGLLELAHLRAARRALAFEHAGPSASIELVKGTPTARCNGFDLLLLARSTAQSRHAVHPTDDLSIESQAGIRHSYSSSSRHAYASRHALHRLGQVSDVVLAVDHHVAGLRTRLRSGEDVDAVARSTALVSAELLVVSCAHPSRWCHGDRDRRASMPTDQRSKRRALLARPSPHASGPEDHRDECPDPCTKSWFIVICPPLTPAVDWLLAIRHAGHQALALTATVSVYPERTRTHGRHSVSPLGHTACARARQRLVPLVLDH